MNTSDPISWYQIKLTDQSGKTVVKHVSAQQAEVVEVGGLYRHSKYCVTMAVISEEGSGKVFGETCTFTSIDGKNKRLQAAYTHALA